MLKTHYSPESALNIITDTLYFDTVDHNIIIECIKELGIESSSLRWLTSLCNDRISSVTVNNYISPPIEILYGVPQSSVVGPLLFSIYLHPLSKIICKFYNITYHIYAYDIQLISNINVN